VIVLIVEKHVFVNNNVEIVGATYVVARRVMVITLAQNLMNFTVKVAGMVIV
jgi:hypothetical protein